MVDPGHTGGDHIDPDAGEGAALAEVDSLLVGEDEFQLGRIPGPERQAEGKRRGILGLDCENLAVAAAPKMVGLHGGEKGLIACRTWSASSQQNGAGILYWRRATKSGVLPAACRALRPPCC